MEVETVKPKSAKGQEIDEADTLEAVSAELPTAGGGVGRWASGHAYPVPQDAAMQQVDRI